MEAAQKKVELLFSDEEGAGCCSRVGRQGARAGVDPGHGAPGTLGLKGPHSPVGSDTPHFFLPREGPPAQGEEALQPPALAVARLMALIPGASTQG